MSPQDCPSETDILDLAEGRLTGDKRVVLLAHLDVCEECRQIVAAIAPDNRVDAGLATFLAQDVRRAPKASSDRSPPIELEPGKLVAGRYRVKRLLGSGGMGAVFEAEHVGLDKRVALKLVKSDLAIDDEAVSRLLREAKAAASLGGEHVVAVLDAGRLEETGDPFVVYEYLEGEDLAHLLAKRARLPMSFAVDLILAACEALTVAHARDIVHRDIKPANLFLTERADGSPLLKVLDFGIAKVGWSDGAKTSRRAILGSPRYMAPEQLRSSSSVDGRADVWSLGVTLFELISGEAPFHGDSVIELCAAIATEPPRDLLATLIKAEPLSTEESNTLNNALVTRLGTVLTWCLEKSCEKRCPDVSTLAASLESFASEDGKASARRVTRIHQRMLSAPPASGSIPLRGASSTPSGVPVSEPGAAADPATASTLSVTFGESSKAVPRSARRWALPLIAGTVMVSALIAGFALRHEAPLTTSTTAHDIAPSARPLEVALHHNQTANIEERGSVDATSSPSAPVSPSTQPKAGFSSASQPGVSGAPAHVINANNTKGGKKTDGAPSAQTVTANPFYRDGLNDRH